MSDVIELLISVAVRLHILVASSKCLSEFSRSFFGEEKGPRIAKAKNMYAELFNLLFFFHLIPKTDALTLQCRTKKLR